MISKILDELKRFDEIEDAFGKDMLDVIVYEKKDDSYAVNIPPYDPVILTLNDFESDYCKLISYLTDLLGFAVNYDWFKGFLLLKPCKYYRDWLLYKQSYNCTKAAFYYAVKDLNDEFEIFDTLIKMLEDINRRAVDESGSVSPLDFTECSHIVMRYVGKSRAIRDLSMKYLENNSDAQQMFQLRNMTPDCLIDKYGCIFYLGNDFSQWDICSYYRYVTEYGSVYVSFYKQLYENTDPDIPGNGSITQTQREEMREKMKSEVCYDPVTDTLIDEFDQDSDDDEFDDWYDYIDEFDQDSDDDEFDFDDI